MPRTTVVSVTFNSAETVGEMVDSLRPAIARGVVALVLVDNASRDDTPSRIDAWQREGLARAVHAGSNIGFGRGCNLGVRHADTEFVLLLNPDARIEPEGVLALERILDDEPDAAVVAPGIERPDGSLQPVGALPTLASMILERTRLQRPFLGAARPDRAGPPIATRWVSGAAFMVRRAVFESLGGFDPRFFLYFEESDLFRRILRAGHRVLAAGSVVCPHIGGHSAGTVASGRIAGSIAEHFIRSRNYYARKHFGVLPMAIADLAFATTLMLRGTLTRNPNDSAAWRARRTVPLFAMPASPHDPALGVARPAIDDRRRPAIATSDAA